MKTNRMTPTHSFNINCLRAMNQLLPLQPISLLLLLLSTPLTSLPHPFRRRIHHHPIFPSPSPSPPYPNHPFFPKVPAYASQPSPPPPSNAASYGPIPTSTSSSSSTNVVPSKKLAITVSVAIVTLGMLSALAFFLCRRHRHPSPSDSRKLVDPSLPRGGFSQEEEEDDDDPSLRKNFLYLGTVEPSSVTSGNSDALKCSPYRKLNSGKRMEFGRYRPSPELTPLPPLVRLPPPDSIVQMMSSEEDEEEIVACRRTETAFCTPRGSLVSNDEGYYTTVSRQSVRSNSNGSGKSNTSSSNGDSNGNRNSDHLAVLHSKRTSPQSRLSGSLPDMKHIIIPSIKQEVRLQNLRPRFTAPLLPPNAALHQSISSSTRMSKVSTQPPPPPPQLPPPPPPIPRPLMPTAGMPAPKMGEIPTENRGANRLKSRGGGSSRDDAGLSNGINDAEAIDKITGSGSLERQNGDERDTGRPKLKPLHWDKVRASSDRATVWDQIKSSSFQVNENMMETLFGFNTNNATIPKDQTRRPGWATSDHDIRVLDPKKSQNIAILLRALNVTRDEVSEALLDGNSEGLGTELLETLVKMAPTKEEEIRLRDYSGDVSKLGTAERFLKAILDIPFAFKRIEIMLYRANFNTEVMYLRNSFQTLEVASEELRNSRPFFKLLEAVLRTGNRLNVGTTRGDARAFKLDTLLKLVDIKGADGKTTLLHFVVQEIIRSESEDANQVKDNIQTKVQSLSLDGFREQGLKVITGLSRDLSNVKKAAAMDSDVLSSYLSKLDMGLEKVRQVPQYPRPDMQGRFFDSITVFIREAEDEIVRIKGEEKKALSQVKEATEYFHGDAAKEEAHPLRIFQIVRDFLSNLDQVCKDVGRMQDGTIVGAVRSFHVSSTVLLPVTERYNHGETGSSDDDSS